MTKANRNFQKLKYTSDLYGKKIFKYFNTEGLADGMVKYHKSNFQKYFGLKEGEFKGLRILDTGTGTGRHAIVLALMGANVTAADLSPDNLMRANALKAYYGLENIEFIQHDFMKPFGGQFDLVSAHCWVQHTENPAYVIKNLVSSLKVGGRLYLSVYLAGTFRFFVAQVAREVLKPEWHGLAEKFVKYHFPTGFKQFNNPGDISMENMFDDFFVPYCNTTTYDLLMADMKKLDCLTITAKPQIPDLEGLDSTYLRMGFEKSGTNLKSGLKFTGPMMDEFISHLPHVKESAKLAKKAIALFKKRNDPTASVSFALGLFRVRAETNRSLDGKKKHAILQNYLKSVLSKELKEISVTDTMQIWDELAERPIPPGQKYY
jgi:2-polyprenyl-3-methyl-5-hydroxy-6-metoxy-1,4-benzoquinol methylase